MNKKPVIVRVRYEVNIDISRAIEAYKRQTHISSDRAIAMAQEDVIEYLDESPVAGLIDQAIKDVLLDNPQFAGLVDVTKVIMRE